MKIDLHCHTKRVKSGDSKYRNVTPELFKEKIELADIKIVAITNHNAFDYEQYQILRDTVKGSCQVWPGVEIDMSGDSKFHLIVVTKPEDSEAFSNSVQKLFVGEDVNTCLHTIEEVYATFKDYDAIYIPHFHDKKPAISEADKDKLIEVIGDTSRVFIEPRNHRTLGVLANKDMSVLIGSDVQDWRRYEECTFAEIRLPVGSFSEFLLLARRDHNVVETLLNKKTAIEIVGKPHESVDLFLRLYPDVNIVFGPKGTGKTEILKSLYNKMISDGKNCKKYIASERNDDFAQLTNLRDMEQDISKVHADSCEEEFGILSQWSDCNPTLFSNYLDWIRTRGNSNNKSRMKITEAVHDYFHEDDSFDVHQCDYCGIKNVITDLYEIDIEEYLDIEEKKVLLKLLFKLKGSIYNKRKKDLIDMYASQLTNTTIDRIKALADRNSDTVSRPSTVGLKSFAKRRLQLLKAVNVILKNLSLPEYNERVRLGSLEDKGEIFINYKYRMLCTEERRANYPGYSISALRNIKQELEYIKDHIFDEDIAVQVESLNTDCEEQSIDSVKPFLGRSKQIITADGIPYSPSNGEKGILLLEQTLHEDADAYFLDEPELGMGNSYIDTDIRPIISDLAKRRKLVFVATHNANIAVRTLPYVSIFRTHENGVYKTYIGNPFDDRLVNIDDEQDVRSWTEESMHSLEGGRDAFYERRDIYESKDS